MTNVNVGYGITDPTHDLSLSDGVSTYGMIFAGGTRVLQETPLSPPAQAFENEQKNWIGGRGRIRYEDDPTGFFDSDRLWSTSDEKLMPMLQWRFAKGVRNCDSSLPDDNASMAWWKLYGNDPTNKIARYLTIPFIASASYSADKGYLWIRRRGTPVSNLLTFELCSAGVSKPGTVLKTVTKTVSDITDTISVFQLFDWTSTESLTSGTTYYIKIYGGAGDTAANHWQVLCNAGGTSSKYSTDDSTWTTSTVSMYYRVTDADSARQWRFFLMTSSLLHAVSQPDSGSSTFLKTSGVKGVATAGTSTTLTCSALAMTTDQFVGAYIRIWAGTGDGQARQITANTSTQFTVSPAWDITPDTTSYFQVYSTDWWTDINSTGITAVTGKPCTVGGVTYFPQGQSVNIRRIRMNGNSHDVADDGTNKADVMYLSTEGVTPQVYLANKHEATIQTAPLVSWGSNLVPTGARYVGSSEYNINNIFSHNKTVFIFKDDGLYTYNNGIMEKQGNFGDVIDSSTGLGVGAQNNYMWFGWGHSVVRMAGGTFDDMLNFKRGFDGIPADRRGVISCIVSAIGWLFFVVDGGTSNYSSIICWNGMGWHEIFRGWATGVRIRNAAWQSNLDSRGRLWFDIGGDMAYIEFPKFAANPLKDTTINYQHEGVIITSTYDAHDQNLYKVLGLLRVFSESGSVEIDYQTNANVGTNTWTVLGTASTQPVTDIDVNLGEIFQIRFRFRLQVTASRTPAVLTGWQLSGRVMALDKYQYLCTFRADSDAETKGDENDHDPNALYDQLVTWAARQTKLTLRSSIKSVDNAGSGRIVTVSLPAKSVDSLDTEENKWTGRIQIAMLEV